MRVFCVISVSFALVSCGSPYNSPRISDAPNLQVIDLTAQSVQTANLSPYTPKQLPYAYTQTPSSTAAVPQTLAVPDVVLTQRPSTPALRTRLPSPAEVQPYILGTGDVIRVSMPSDTDPLGELPGQLGPHNSVQTYTVQSDGAITIPGVDRVMIGGLTIEAAEAELFQRLVANQLDPTFSLEVAEFKSQTVSIGGAVDNPAVLPLDLTPMTLSKALVHAGGVALDDPSGASIRLYRGGNLYQIPLAQLRSDADLQHMLLIDGDSLYIDGGIQLEQAQTYFEQQIGIAQTRQVARELALLELKTEFELRRAELEDQRAAFEARRALGSEPQDYAYIMGEVSQQTRYALPYGQRASLADALFDAASGVPIGTGDASQIYVIRASSNGDITAFRLNGRNAIAFTLAPKLELRPDDIIFVAEHPVTRWGRIVEQITPSLITTGANIAAN